MFHPDIPIFPTGTGTDEFITPYRGLFHRPIGILALAGACGGWDDEVDLLVESQSRHRAAYRRAQLPPVNESPFIRIWGNGEAHRDSSVEALTGFNTATITNTLLPDFAASRTALHPPGPGRPLSLGHNAALCLTLAYLKSQGTLYSLCPTFGATPAVAQRTAWEGILILNQSLAANPHARMGIPTDPAVLMDLARRTQAHGLDFLSCVGFMDGLKLAVLVPRDRRRENANYSGYTGLHDVSNVFLTLADGTIAAAALNRFGSWGDVTVARGIIRAILTELPWPYSIVADTAFPAGVQALENYGSKIVSGLTKGDKKRLEGRGVRAGA